MKCKKCQKEISLEFKICPYCGESVLSAEISEENLFDETDKSEGILSASVKTQNGNEEIKEKSISGKEQKPPKKKRVIITIVIFLLIVAGAAGYYFLYSSKLILAQTSEKIEAADEIDSLKLVALSSKNADKYTFAVKENTIKANVPGEYTVTYSLTNKKNNKAQDQTLKFKVVDTTAPVFCGPDGLKIALGKEFDALKIIEFKDVVDGAIDPNTVDVSGSVNINALGQYELIFSVSDKAGNKTTKTVIIEVMEMGDPDSFFEKIAGTWVNYATNITCHFYLKNGHYFLQIGYYESEGFAEGALTFLSQSCGGGNAVFYSWDYAAYTIDENNNIKYSAVEKKTVLIEHREDKELMIDLGLEKREPNKMNLEEYELLNE